MFGKIDLEVEDNVRDINDGDDRLKGEVVDNLVDIVSNRKEATGKFWLKFRINEKMLAQK